VYRHTLGPVSDPLPPSGFRAVSCRGRKRFHWKIAQKWRFFEGFALPGASTFDTIMGAASGVTPYYIAPYTLGAT